jgi:hypothetical protein
MPIEVENIVTLRIVTTMLPPLTVNPVGVADVPAQSIVIDLLMTAPKNSPLSRQAICPTANVWSWAR